MIVNRLTIDPGELLGGLRGLFSANDTYRYARHRQKLPNRVGNPPS